MSECDEALVALSNEAREARMALTDLLHRDPRDASDIPGYSALADRHLASCLRLGETPAKSVRGLIAKAAAIDPRDAAMQTDAAIMVAFSLMADVLSVLRQS